MANNFKQSNLAVNTGVDAITALVDNGYLRIYDGSQPATVDTALGSQALLAELRFGATAFGAASAGVATAASITSDSSANATGTAAWFRAFGSDGTTAVWDGSVGTSGSDCDINSVSISSGASVGVSSMTYTLPKA